jgi:hypothetical protein
MMDLTLKAIQAFTISTSTLSLTAGVVGTDGKIPSEGLQCHHGLETVGIPSKGHIKLVTGLALPTTRPSNSGLSSPASPSLPLTFRFLLVDLILSPDARQLAYIKNTNDVSKICICDTPPVVLTQARVCIPQTSFIPALTLLMYTGHCTQKSTLDHLLHVRLSFFYLLHHSPIAIIVVSCNSSSSCRVSHTTNICYNYSAETSAYERPAATLFPSPRQISSLLPSYECITA